MHRPSRQNLQNQQVPRSISHGPSLGCGSFSRRRSSSLTWLPGRPTGGLPPAGSLLPVLPDRMDHHDHLALGAWGGTGPTGILIRTGSTCALWPRPSGLLIVTVSTNLLVPAVTRQRYDLIMVDAYQDIAIPFQMSSTEFFTMVSNHLNPGRVMPGHDGQNELDRYHHQGGRPLPTVPLARGIQRLVRGSLERSDWVLSALGAWKRKRGIRIWPKNSADEENRRVSGSGR